MHPLVLRSKGKYFNVSAPDAAFSFLPFTVQQIGRHFRPDPSFDLRTYANISVAKEYWVKTNGNDADTGADEAHALANVSTAISKADADRVYVKSGVYAKGHGWDTVSPARSLQVIGYGGDVIVSYHQHNLTLTAVDAHYTAPATTEIISCYDASNLDVNGDYTALTKKASEAEVDGAVNSWWWSANILYIHTFDARLPDDNIRPFPSGGAGAVYQDDAVTYYLENLKFHGGYHTFSRSSTNAAAKTYAKNCEFSYAHSGNCFNVIGNGETILQNCLVTKALLDGYKIIESGGTYSNLVLIDCIGRSCGTGGGSTANGVSRHDRGCTVIINGHFYKNVGRNIHDVHASIGNSYSWLLGVHGYNSLTSNINFACGQGTGNPLMWLDTCQSEQAAVADLDAGAGATINYHDMSPASPSQTGAGTFTAY